MTESARGAEEVLSIGDATIQVVDALTPAELLAAITPERIGAITGYSASSIRYRLNSIRAGAAGDAESAPRGWGFDREQLLLAAVDALTHRLDHVARTSRDRYLETLTSVEQTGTLDPFAIALEAELDAYAVGAADDGIGGESERMSLIALAATDGSVAIAQRLRAASEGRHEMFRPVYEVALRLTGRELRPGLTIRDLVDEVNTYLHGLTVRRRFDPALDQQRLMQTVLAIFVGLTQPRSGPSDDPGTELLKGMFGDAPTDPR